MLAKNGVGTRLGSRVCSQYQLMIYTSFSNASVPFASAQLNATCRPNPLHSSVQIGGLGAQADGDTQTQTNTDAHRRTLKVTSQCPPPPTADENLAWNSICNGEECHCKWVNVPVNPHGCHDSSKTEFNPVSGRCRHLMGRPSMHVSCARKVLYLIVHIVRLESVCQDHRCWTHI